MLKKITLIFFYIYFVSLLFLLIYVFYKDFLLFNSNLRHYYKFYYYFLITILFIGIFFFIIKKIRIYFFIFTISLLASFYLFEFYKSYKILVKNYSNKNIFNYIDDLKHLNPVIPIAGENHKNNLYFLSGISNTLTIHCNESGFFSKYFSDRYGFNNPDYLWSKKKIEIFLLGDSYVHGACVDSGNDIASHLRDIARKDVINLGWNGNSILKEYATFIEYAKDINFEYVFIFYFESNDLDELKDELKNNILKKYLQNKSFSQNLKENNNIINNIKLDTYKNFLEKSKDIYYPEFSFKKKFLFNFIKLNNVRYLIFNFINLNLNQNNLSTENLNNASMEDYLLILKKLNQEVLLNNAELVFVYLPKYKQYSTTFLNKNALIEKKKLLNHIRNMNIKIIDIDYLISKKISDPLSLYPNRTDGHFNNSGYQFIAKEINNFLEIK
jgi:hypothetical protein